MVSKEMVEIIIKAQDQASDNARKVDESLEKIGKTSADATQSTHEFDNALLKANNSLGVVGTGASQAANLLHQMKLDPNFGSTMDRARLSVSQMGYDISSTRGKFQVLKTAGSETFNNLKQKVSSTANELKGKFSNAVNSAKNHLEQLKNKANETGQGFSRFSGIISEVAGNIVTDLVYGMVDLAKQSINASNQVEYFSGRLNLSASETANFKKELSDLQSEYKKIDMTSVGASALDLATRMEVPNEKLGELTEMIAVTSSEFVKNGSTQENAILGVADALDGQWTRLKEIGIGQEDLMRNGWSGDLNDKIGLIDAMNKTLAENGYDQTAKDITNLNDAYMALQVAGGLLLQKVIVPLTPALISIAEGFIGVADAIGGAIEYIQNNGWLQGALAIGIVTAGLLLLYGASLSVEGGLMALVVSAMPSFIGSIYAAATALWTMEAPLLPIILILGALALAIYEVGIYFGWWTDIGSMIDAIATGLGRMWNAFVNHPDVQALIGQLKDAWKGLSEWIGQAWQSLSDFFNLGEGGDFDIVHALIMNVGNAFNILKEAIGFVVGVVQGVIYVFTTLYLVFDMIVQHINLIILTFQQFLSGQISLSTMLSQIWVIISSMFSSVFNIIVARVITWTAVMVSRALAMANQFVNTIVNKVKQLPGKVYAQLVAVVSKIVSAGQQWVSNAKTKAQAIISGVVSILSGLPGQISSALSGVVSAITQPFKSAYDSVVNVVNDLKNKVNEGMDYISSLGGAAGYELTGAGFDLGLTSSTTESHDVLDINYSITLNLEKVPASMNTQELINAFNDKNVLSALTSNRDFQDLDAKVKSRIASKQTRARGI